MPKSKQGPALFEIMRSAESLAKKKGPSAPAQKGGDQVPDPAPAVDRVPSAEAGKIAGAARTDDRPSDAGPPRPWIEVASGQVRFALTSRAMAVAIFALGMFLVAAYAVGVNIGRGRGEKAGYQAGKMDAQAPVLDDIQAARAAATGQNLFEGIGESPVIPGTADSVEPIELTPVQPLPATVHGTAWVRGYTYVVVQDFRSDAGADVERAQRYLIDNGIETAVAELSGDWKYRLIATQGFNRDDSVQRKLADDFLARIRKVGQAYFQAGGRYRLEGYLKKLTADQW